MRSLISCFSIFRLVSVASLSSKTYAKELSAVDNGILAFFTFGEGYHNYHHAMANDYRNGIHWYHFDPTKWLLWICSKVGLVGSGWFTKAIRFMSRLQFRYTSGVNLVEFLISNGNINCLVHIKAQTKEKSHG